MGLEPMLEMTAEPKRWGSAVKGVWWFQEPILATKM
jgi:hypothetical protein